MYSFFGTWYDVPSTTIVTVFSGLSCSVMLNLLSVQIAASVLAGHDRQADSPLRATGPASVETTNRRRRQAAGHSSEQPPRWPSLARSGQIDRSYGRRGWVRVPLLQIRQS